MTPCAVESSGDEEEESSLDHGDFEDEEMGEEGEEELAEEGAEEELEELEEGSECSEGPEDGSVAPYVGPQGDFAKKAQTQMINTGPRTAPA